MNSQEEKDFYAGFDKQSLEIGVALSGMVPPECRNPPVGTRIVLIQTENCLKVEGVIPPDADTY